MLMRENGGLWIEKAAGDDGSHGGGKCEDVGRSSHFLMAATAFLAASSRLSAAVMGRPLSVRILLAS